MPSPEEPAAAAGLRPINCSPSSPFPLRHGEFTKFSERSKSLTKAAEPEGPWTPQPGKNAVREGDTQREEAGRTDSADLFLYRCWQVTEKESIFPVSLSDSNQSRLLTQCRVTLFGVGRSEMGIEVSAVNNILTHSGSAFISISSHFVWGAGEALCKQNNVLFLPAGKKINTEAALNQFVILCIQRRSRGRASSPMQGVCSETPPPNWHASNLGSRCACSCWLVS